MLKVLAEVVTHKWTHGHWIVHNRFTLHNQTLVGNSNGKKFITLPVCSAAAVASDFTQAPTKTPWAQLKLSKIKGTPKNSLELQHRIHVSVE